MLFENYKHSEATVMMIAYATNDQGIRNIIGLEVYDRESKETWTNFFQSLKERGLKEVLMITSDLMI